MNSYIIHVMIMADIYFTTALRHEAVEVTTTCTCMRKWIVWMEDKLLCLGGALLIHIVFVPKEYFKWLNHVAHIPTHNLHHIPPLDKVSLHACQAMKAIYF